MKINLNFDWQFIDNYETSYVNEFPKNYETVDIPHCIKKIPGANFLDTDYKKIVTYRKVFTLKKPISKNELCFIDFDGFMCQADIYINKQRIGKYYSMWNKVSIDVTKEVNLGENELIVILDSREDPRFPPFGGQMNYLNFGGIYKKVTLRIVPKIYIERSLVTASIEGRVSIKDIVKGDLSAKYTIKHEIFKGKERVAFSSISAFIIDFPELWSPDTPKLYTLKTTVESRYGQDTFKTRFGFRDIRIAQDGVFINNSVIKIAGVNRLESFPYVGLAMPKAGQENDADLIKYKLGFNAVKCVGFPAHEDFLNRCDEIGLLVISEPPSSTYVSANDQWRNQYIQNVKNKVLDEYNHPCILANSIRIDGAREDRELFEETDTEVKEIDNIRSTFGAYSRLHGPFPSDIIGFNDYSSRNLQYGLVNPILTNRLLKPYFISDYIGKYDLCKVTDDFAAKTNHALHHLRVFNDVNRYKEILGSFTSSFTDYYVPYALSSGDNIFYSGLLDLYRSKKPVAEAYYSQQDDKPMIKVLATMKPYDSGNQVLGKIIVLTNGDYVELFKDNCFVKRFYPNMKGFNELKHPPILVDDLLGKSLQDPRFDEKENLELARIFSKKAIYGDSSLNIFDRLTIKRISSKHRITERGMEHLFNRYLGPNVIEQANFVFRVYKNDEWVISETFAPPNEFDLSIDVQKTELINDETFDVSKVHIKYVDQTNHVIETANFGLKTKIEGPLSLLSGEEIVTLKSGQCAIWVRTHKQTGPATLTISVEGIEKKIQFNILKKKND